MAEYIDKELVIDTIEELKSKALPKALLFDHLKKVIEIFPTEDLAPVQHGHWIKIGNYAFKCTSCGKVYWDSKGYAARTHFCPNCGAKMDGETE